MNKKKFTAMLHLKGWMVKDALSRWGRSQDWWTDNTNGDDKAQQRLLDMINGLPEKK